MVRDALRWAGYHVVVPHPRPGWLSPELAADPVVSVSPCLAGLAPSVHWLTDIRTHLTELGIDDAALDEATAWLRATDDHNGYPNVFVDLDEALTFAERFLGDLAAQVLGVAMATPRVDRFLARHDRLVDQSDGIVEALRTGLAPAPAGELLGWELLCIEHGGITCSWSCNHLQPKLGTPAELALNEHGLIGDTETASRLAEAVRPLPKESGVWDSFAILRYR